MSGMPSPSTSGDVEAPSSSSPVAASSPSASPLANAVADDGSSTLDETAEFDRQLLQRTLADTGRWAFGTVWVEVWLLTEDRTSLIQPTAGCWVDPTFHNNNCGHNCPVCQVTRPSHPEYIPPERVVLGEGLPGILWSDSRDHHHHHLGRNNIGNKKEPLEWRDMEALANDPHRPWNPRLHQLTRAGLGWAAAVPIFGPHDLGHTERQGIVIFMARRHVDPHHLRSPSNEEYIRVASNLVGAAMALRKPRQTVVHERREELAKTIRRVRAKIMALVFFGQCISDVVDGNAETAEHERAHSWRSSRFASFLKLGDGTKDSPSYRVALGEQFRNALHALVQRFATTVEKCKGGKVPLPPSFGWWQTVHSVVGCFVTILLLTYLNRALVTHTDAGESVRLVLGPFGALVTLIYGLTAAPAAQPRNAVAGQVVAVSIALLVRYWDGLEEEVRISLSVALAVGAMVKLGLTHPPAGASAAIFASSERWEWSHMAMLVVGNLITVFLAAVINNWSAQRQYPTYWGVGSFQDTLAHVWQLLPKPPCPPRRRRQQQQQRRKGDTHESSSKGDNDSILDDDKLTTHLSKEDSPPSSSNTFPRQLPPKRTTEHTTPEALEDELLAKVESASSSETL